MYSLLSDWKKWITTSPASLPTSPNTLPLLPNPIIKNKVNDQEDDDDLTPLSQPPVHYTNTNHAKHYLQHSQLFPERSQLSLFVEKTWKLQSEQVLWNLSVTMASLLCTPLMLALFAMHITASDTATLPSVEDYFRDILSPLAQQQQADHNNESDRKTLWEEFQAQKVLLQQYLEESRQVVAPEDIHAILKKVKAMGKWKEYPIS